MQAQAPGQVQRGSGEGSKGHGENLGGFGAEPGHVQQGSGDEKYFHFTIYLERQSENIAMQVCIQVDFRQTLVDDTHKSKREVYKESFTAHKIDVHTSGPCSSK